MKITNISQQARDNNRVNVSVDGSYRFSLDIFQVGQLGLKLGGDYSEAELLKFEQESQFGKLYARALEYSMVRPRSVKELRDYLWRKTLNKKTKNQQGEIIDKLGVSPEIADRVLERLIEKGYLDDEKFARFWFEHRFMQKGTSLRRLRLELSQKGVDSEIVERLTSENIRSDEEELQKIIAKKQARYADHNKFVQYLLRQGFNYGMIKDALGQEE